jgi:hypothetical protein
LIISSPNKRLYSDVRAYVNPFHLQELYRDDLACLMGKRFPAQRWYHQRLACWSGIWPEPVAQDGDDALRLEAWIGDADRLEPYPTPEGMYFIVIAARAATALPIEDASVSLFTDAEDSELKRAEANAREILRLDALLIENTEAVARHTYHIHHLEALVLERNRIIGERDIAVAGHVRHIQELEALAGERERIIEARESQLAAANAVGAERDAELARRAETIASLGRRSAALESETTRLQAALAKQERALASRQSLRGWIDWTWRCLRRWLAS